MHDEAEGKELEGCDVFWPEFGMMNCKLEFDGCDKLSQTPVISTVDGNYEKQKNFRVNMLQTLSYLNGEIQLTVKVVFYRKRKIPSFEKMENQGDCTC